MKLNCKQVFFVDEGDWNELVASTYKKRYNLQQQDGCMEKGTAVNFTVPSEVSDTFYNDTLPEEVNSSSMGVSFPSWLARDSDQKPDDWREFDLELFWERNFYPDLEVLANDMYSKGLLDAGDYVIHIYW